MAKFDKSKDVALKSWNISGDSDGSLAVSVMSYNQGELKLQIGPRTFSRRDGSVGYQKAGRMTMAEVMSLNSIMPEIRGIMGESVSALTRG